MRVHIVGLFHTIPTDDFSHCAFTGKVQRLPRCLKAGDVEDVVLYGNGSQDELLATGADEVYPIIDRSTLGALYEKHGGLDQVYRASQDVHLKKLYEVALIQKMRGAVKPGDIVCHPFGNTHAELLKKFPGAIHVESGIGYMAGGFGCQARIFESQAWRHFQMGRYSAGAGQVEDLATSYVVPNYYDVEDWPLGRFSIGLDRMQLEDDPYVLFIGRLQNDKGVHIVGEIAQQLPDQRFVIAGGPGEVPECLKLPNVEFIGLVKGKDRAMLYGDAMCTLAPSQYCEPFGGVAAEALLCGTPVLASDWGGFTDYVPEEDRCRTVDDYVTGIKDYAAMGIGGREQLRLDAQQMFGLEPCGRKYREIFEELRKGW